MSDMIPQFVHAFGLTPSPWLALPSVDHDAEAIMTPLAAAATRPIP